MSEPFRRTTRYLESDSGRLALAGVVLGLVVALIWLAWLFLARVPLYERAQAAAPAPDGAYLVAIDPQVAARLEPGQAARVRPLTAEGTLLEARVSAIDIAAGVVQVELTDEASVANQSVGAEVWIVVEEVSPATLIARAVEQNLITP